MKTISIRRIAQSEKGTFGVMIEDEMPFLITVERPWLNNKKNESCIPEGAYKCKRIDSPRFGNTFEILDVENRTDILFHPANTMADLEGCIGIGKMFGTLGHGDIPAVLLSKDGFSTFLVRFKDTNEFILIIENKWL